MLIATSTDETTGRRALFLGLQQENVDRLLNDQPIRKNLDEEGVAGLEAWDLYVLGPEDTARFVAQVGSR